MDLKQAMETAIRMERDGHDFYKKAAARSNSSMGRSVFESLAADEMQHLETFRQIFRDDVPEIDLGELSKTSEKYEDLPVFPKDPEGAGVEPDADELEALHTAMDAEERSIDYYTRVMADAEDPGVKAVLEKIIEQEKSHFALLSDELDHMNSTGYWYDINPQGL